MKRTTRRLGLSKETIGKLSNRQLGGVVGAAPNIIAKSSDPDDTGCPDTSTKCQVYTANGCQTFHTCHTICTCAVGGCIGNTQTL